MPRDVGLHVREEIVARACIVEGSGQPLPFAPVLGEEVPMAREMVLLHSRVGQERVRVEGAAELSDNILALDRG